MEAVARILGVEMGEEFEIVMPNKNCCVRAFFRVDGLAFVEHNVSSEVSWKPYVLQHLLTGLYTIKRKPWKPSIDESYYHVCSEYIDRYVWRGDDIDTTFYKIGNCYKTHEEAEVNRDKWIAFYASDEVLEV